MFNARHRLVPILSLSAFVWSQPAQAVWTVWADDHLIATPGSKVEASVHILTDEVLTDVDFDIVIRREGAIVEDVTAGAILELVECVEEPCYTATLSTSTECDSTFSWTHWRYGL